MDLYSQYNAVTRFHLIAIPGLLVCHYSTAPDLLNFQHIWYDIRYIRYTLTWQQVHKDRENNQSRLTLDIHFWTPNIDWSMKTFDTKHYVYIDLTYLGGINSPWANSPIKQHQVAHTKLTVLHQLCQPKCDMTNLPNILCRLTLKGIRLFYPTCDRETNLTRESHHLDSLSLALWFLHCLILRHISLSAWF